MNYFLRRIGIALATLFVLITMTFFLLRLAPGGPFDGEKAWPPEIKANINARYGLDKPLVVQYFDWLGDVLRGDLRESFQYDSQPVTKIIFDALPMSLGMGTAALLLSILIGIPLGGLAARKKETWWDTSAMFVAISGVTLPGYLTASLLVLVFSLWLGWLPPALLDGPASLILPIATLTFRPLAMVARLTRASLNEAIKSDYIRSALAKGMSYDAAFWIHALKNSMIPVLSLLGPITANLITGSFVVEIVFQLPGLGKHFVSAVLNRDYPLVLGVTLFYGAILLTANLIVDMIYGWVDPRIRFGELRG